MGAMQRLEGLIRRAVQDWQMIENGDSICVGVSGGKDSVALTLALARLARYHEKSFTVKALTLDPCFSGVETDYSPIEKLFASYSIPYTVQRTNIGHVVFDIRQEKNPCALCANLRRGALHTGAIQMGCNKVALGHHLDDVIETFYMNLFGEGRIGCFAPITWLSQKEITLIRPLVLAEERQVINAVNDLKLPIVKSRCPVDGDTERASAKEFVRGRTKQDPAFRQKTLGAMQKSDIDHWAPVSPTNSTSNPT